MDGGVVVPDKIFHVKSYVTGSRLVLAESASRKSLIYSLYVIYSMAPLCLSDLQAPIRVFYNVKVGYNNAIMLILFGC